MNVSTRSEYGLRALIHLADADGRGAAPAREIADRWNAPVKYLELWARARVALVGVLDQTTIVDLCTPANRANLVSLKSFRN